MPLPDGGENPPHPPGLRRGVVVDAAMWPSNVTRPGEGDGVGWVFAAAPGPVSALPGPGNRQNMKDQKSRRGDEKAGHDQPGTVSDQNAEEQPGPGSDPGSRRGASEGNDEPSGGESGEGSQSTGHPDSAG